jgi:signal transduction histidine kinase
LVLPLGRRGRPLAEVQLRVDPDGPPFDPAEHPAGPAWHAWADLVADRDRLARRLGAVIAAYRQRVETGEHELRQAKLEALAEFAAGAGHELNNPLAVIQGRAQLLLAEADEPGMVRSLRAIISQAQRAHRMLRDLMYVARPPAQRPRACRPDEVILNCVRDLQDEAEVRKVRLLAEPGGAPSAWTDPDPLRHLAEVLLRNALEATPAGGTVRITTSGDARRLDWIVHDGGRGIDLREGRHLLDPFFCGRQAGRGLGLGLPRAARAAALAGGGLTWRSSPGRGTSFHLTMPLSLPPEEADALPSLG